MSDQTLAVCLLLSPFAILWLGFAAAETARAVVAIRQEGRK